MQQKLKLLVLYRLYKVSYIAYDYDVWYITIELFYQYSSIVLYAKTSIVLGMPSGNDARFASVQHCGSNMLSSILLDQFFGLEVQVLAYIALKNQQKSICYHSAEQMPKSSIYMHLAFRLFN